MADCHMLTAQQCVGVSCRGASLGSFRRFTNKQGARGLNSGGKAGWVRMLLAERQELQTAQQGSYHSTALTNSGPAVERQLG